MNPIKEIKQNIKREIKVLALVGTAGIVLTGITIFKLIKDENNKTLSE